jgi:hypothetical protein
VAPDRFFKETEAEIIIVRRERVRLKQADKVILSALDESENSKIATGADNALASRCDLW